nr:hypothetical protein [Pseudomonas putida]
MLANTDNYGRNTSIMRVGGRFRLESIYDLAPMILDEEGITRTTKWAAERKGSSNCATTALSLLVTPIPMFCCNG